MDKVMRSYLSRELARLDAERVRPAPDAMPFGKYRGRSFAAIPAGYLRWVMRNLDSAELRDRAARELARRVQAGLNGDGESNTRGER